MEPYGFEPNPNVTPSQYGTSSIGWTYNSKLEIPDYIRLYYRYIDRLATDYLVSQAPGAVSYTHLKDIGKDGSLPKAKVPLFLVKIM